MDNRSLRLSFKYGDHVYDYLVFYSADRQEKIAIHVFPNGAIQVDVPKDAEISDVKKAVMKRARWIATHVSEAKERLKHILPREYVSGESHYYLGRRYVLKVLSVRNEKPEVKLLRGKLLVRCQKTSSDDVSALLASWYRVRAQTVFKDRLQAVSSSVAWLGAAPQVKMRSMKKQWGSCSASGTIVLNPSLVKAPRECVDYVIIHELCHLKEHNHSPKFYRQLESAVPNWRSVKGRLDNMAEVLLG